MLKVGDYVEFKRPKYSYSIKGIIVKVSKSITGSFKNYKIVAKEGSYISYKENMKLADVVPKLVEVQLDSDRTLKELSVMTRNVDICDMDEGMLNAWTNVRDMVNEERNILNIQVLSSILGKNDFNRFIKQINKES